VRIAIEDNNYTSASNRWFNFTGSAANGYTGSFGSYSETIANLANITTSKVDWDITVTLPSGGDYTFYALAVDNAGNQNYFNVGVWPRNIATISNPSSDGQVLPCATTISGAATDTGGAGFDSVNIALQDTNTNRFLDWNTGLFTAGLKTTQANLTNTSLSSTDWGVNVALPPGDYRVNVSVVDNAGNVRVNAAGNTAWTRTDFIVNVGAADTFDPTVTITNPASSGSVIPGSTTLAGTAADIGGSGFDFVEIAIQDTADNKFLDWNSGLFTAGLKTSPANLTNTTNTSTRWNAAVALPAGSYRINVSAKDNAGNQRLNPAGNVVWTRSLFTVNNGAPDASDPTVRITTPASNGQIIPGSTSLTGTAADTGGSGFDFVEVAIQDTSTNRFLDWGTGSFTNGLKSTQANLTNTTVNSTGWDIPVALPAGNYRLNVSAKDQAGNQRLNPAGNIVWTRALFTVNVAAPDTFDPTVSIARP